MDRPRRRRATRAGVVLALAAATLVATGPASAAPVTGPSAEATPTTLPRAAPVRRTVNRTTFRTVGATTAPPSVPLATWAVTDLDTGHLLAVGGAHARRQPASTLKLLTALTAAVRVPEQPGHRVTYAEAHPQFCICVGLTVGRRYSRDALMAAMLLPSANDAAEAMAGSDPRGRRGFLRAMRRVGERLGLTGTRVVNPSGLTARGQTSTARDLLVLLRAAQADPVVAPFLNSATAPFGPVGGPSRTIERSNAYVDTYRHAEGKTGFTTAAGYNLVVATPVRDADRVVRRVGVAALGARSRAASNAATTQLTRWVAEHRHVLRPVGRLPAAPGPVLTRQARWVPS